MRKIVVMLILLLNISLIAQPALAESVYQDKIAFTEKLSPNAKTTYFNPENSTPIPQELNLTDGVFKGPQFPLAAVKLDIRDYTTFYLNFTLNLSYQDVMNGVWDWKLLIPFVSEFADWNLYLNGTWIAGKNAKYEEPGDIPYSNVTHSMERTKYGVLFEFYYALYPHTYSFSFEFTSISSPILYLCREHQRSILTILQSNKTIYEVNAAYAFLFIRGFGQKGMGAISGSEISFYFIDPTKSNKTFTTVGLPVWVMKDTHLTIKIHEYVNGSETFYINKTFTETGFYYIFQSSSRPANWSMADYYSVQFEFVFSKPSKFLFCALSPTTHQYDPNTGEYAADTITFDGRRFDYFGIVYWHKCGSEQYAEVSKQNGVTIYDFGFASVQEYSTGDYVILKNGNWKEYVVVKNITVKSIGAKVDDILFGGKFEFGAGNDILSSIVGGIQKIYDLIKETWKFLQHIGEVIWQYLMKFVKFLINIASWIWDDLGSIFNYILYISVPIAIMFIISYSARWAKGLKVTDEGGRK